MKYIVVFLLAIVFALPSFAQAGVDNCCQLGRACSTDAEWDKGYYDFVNGFCPAPGAAMSQPLQRDGYTFVGQGVQTTQAILLTPGTWQFSAEYSRFGATLLEHLDASGNPHAGGKCLSWPTAWNWYGSSFSRIWIWGSNIYRAPFVVRNNCLIRLKSYHLSNSFNAEYETYKIFLKKIDGNF